MGFFTNLLKSEARKIVSDVVDNVVDNTLGQAVRGQENRNTAANSNTSTTTSASSRTSGYSGSVARASASKASASKSALKSGEASLRANLESVLSSEWSGFEVRREIPAAECGAPEKARAYSYGLYENGQPKAMFLIVTDKNHYLNSATRLAQTACKANGIPCMNFFSHLPNTTEYISQRLKENIQ